MSCFNGRRNSIPVLKDVICSWGESCFHNIHYICRTVEGNCIPSDATVFNAVVDGLCIKNIERTSGCVRISGHYDVFVWFRFNNQKCVGQAKACNIPFTVQVPVFLVGEGLDGCHEIFCEESGIIELEVCAMNRRLEIVEAIVERDDVRPRRDKECSCGKGKDCDCHCHCDCDCGDVGGTRNVCPGCNFRLKIVVEKIFQAFEHGPQIICIPVSPDGCPVPTGGPINSDTAPYRRPTKCPDFCVSDDVFDPNNCDECRPPRRGGRGDRRGRGDDRCDRDCDRRGGDSDRRDCDRVRSLDVSENGKD